MFHHFLILNTLLIISLRNNNQKYLEHVIFLTKACLKKIVYIYTYISTERERERESKRKQKCRPFVWTKTTSVRSRYIDT